MAHVTQAQAQACAHACSSESQRTDTHSHSVSLLFFTCPLLLGSNEGVVTLQIVMHLKCSSMVGVDIDKKLIELANGRKSETLGYLLKNRQNASLEGMAKRSPLADYNLIDYNPIIASLEHLAFVTNNILFYDHRRDGVLDAVFCLSTIKWIHLNHGDEGIRTLFEKVSRMLKMGGIFVLEYQPWRSYQQATKKKGLAELFQKDGNGNSILKNPPDLHIKPEHFKQLLCDDYGFEMIASLEVPTNTYRDRPLTIFKKVS